MPTLTTRNMLQEEALAIQGKDLSGAANMSALYRSLNALDRHALCLSGGGIRSASFALGLIEALAVHPRSTEGEIVSRAEESYLCQFHYLSTVSGGGYIGSWLSSWISRVGFSSLSPSVAGRSDIRPVWQSLVGRDQPENEPKPISWLRDNSNYLTPKLGITSADTWAAIALCFRNLLLNWLVLFPLLGAAILVLKGGAVLTMAFARLPEDNIWPAAVAGGVGALSLLIVLTFICRHRPTRGRSSVVQGRVIGWVIVPATICALAFSWFLVSGYAEVELRGTPRLIWNAVAWFGGDPLWVREHPQIALVATWSLGGASLYSIAWLAAGLKKRDWKDFCSWTFAGAIYAACVGTGVYWYFHVGIAQDFLGLDAKSIPVLGVIVIGVPWILFSLMLADMIFVGLTSYEADSDSDREWLGRTAGWMLAIAVIWPIASYLVFVGSDLALGLEHDATVKLGSIGGLSGLTTLLIGKSRFSSAISEARGLNSTLLNIILGISTPIFTGFLVVIISALLERLLLGHSLLGSSELMTFNEGVSDARLRDGLWLGGGCLGLLATGCFASRCININRFSLHALYRNRLIRAFLGASNPNRKPDPLTQFDISDNLRMSDLWPQNTAKIGHGISSVNWRPFHVINIALNIVSSKRLAWQERKAESFTVSPLHAGSACKNGYRPSSSYGGNISVGTALTISGAAVSPNMGYHSSPGVSLLLALFNVRLGSWLGNPGIEGNGTYTHEGPSNAASPYLKEMFGLTTDDQPYVYLSDGGHFENLGLYEMVRRRCRYIVVSDAGCDPAFSFEDLGNALRKIEIDLGVSIIFSNLEALKNRTKVGPDVGPNVPYYAIGEINYPAADGGGEKGKLLYVKAAYHGVEGAGIRSYASTHLDFPHDATANQWFSESQFESYRALGFETMDGVLNAARRKLAQQGVQSPKLSDLFDVL